MTTKLTIHIKKIGKKYVVVLEDSEGFYRIELINQPLIIDYGTTGKTKVKKGKK